MARKRKNKERPLPSSLLRVTQSNKLVEARYNLPLSEQRLILTMIARVQPDDEDFKPYIISIREFARFLGIDENSMYREAKKITKKLLSRVLSIREDNSLLQINWVSSALYIDDSGVVELSFDPLLKPYLLKIKSSFTSCRLETLLSFKSQYSMRLYTLLKQYQKLGQREIEIEELRELLGLKKNSYSLYSNFKKRIIEPCQKELKEKSDILFEFTEIKYGRRIRAISFTIAENKNPILLKSDIIDQPHSDPSIGFPLELNNTLDTLKLKELQNKNTEEAVSDTSQSKASLDDLIDRIPEKHRHKKTVLLGVEQALKQYGVEYVKRNIEYANRQASNSYAGFLNKSLKEDWGEDEASDRDSQHKNVQIWERLGFESESAYAQFSFEEHCKKLGVPLN